MVVQLAISVEYQGKRVSAHEAIECPRGMADVLPGERELGVLAKLKALELVTLAINSTTLRREGISDPHRSWEAQGTPTPETSPDAS